MANDDADDWLSRALEEYARRRALSELRQEHSYVTDLIEVLRSRPGGLSRQYVLHRLEKDRQKLGLPIPPKFEQAVQSSYNQYCVDSVVFKKRNAPASDGLFYSPGGKGSGVWAVNIDKAGEWLRQRLTE